VPTTEINELVYLLIVKSYLMSRVNAKITMFMPVSVEGVVLMPCT